MIYEVHRFNLIGLLTATCVKEDRVKLSYPMAAPMTPPANIPLGPRPILRMEPVTPVTQEQSQVSALKRYRLRIQHYREHFECISKIYP